MSGVLRGFPPSCPACIWRGDVLKYASDENPCLSRHSPFLRATADAALLIEKITHFWIGHPSCLFWIRGWTPGKSKESGRARNFINIFFRVFVFSCFRDMFFGGWKLYLANLPFSQTSSCDLPLAQVYTPRPCFLLLT
jgi:hypothetical protein